MVDKTLQKGFLFVHSARIGWQPATRVTKLFYDEYFDRLTGNQSINFVAQFERKPENGRITESVSWNILSSLKYVRL